MEHITQGLRPMLLRAMRKAPLADRLEMAWQITVGSAVASRTSIAGHHNGTLTISVPDRGWATQLESLSSEYLRELQQLVPEEVQALRFIAVQ